MAPNRPIDKIKTGLAARALAILAVCLPSGIHAAMTPQQMRSLKGAAQLELTLDKLFRGCGLPASIVDTAPAQAAKQRIEWNGTGMQLSAMDWDVYYGMRQRNSGKSVGWVNAGKLATRCSSGLSQLQLHARGHVGVLSVTKKAQGIGYTTTYREPKSLYRAHKVVAAKSTLTTSLPIEDLVGQYGQPDEVLKQPGARDKFRYWVLTRRDHRPESLHAVDFEIDGGGSWTYTLSSSAVDFVQQRLDALLKQWERDYVLD